MDTTLPPVVAIDPDHLAPGAPLVLARNVQKQFGDLKVLKGIDLALSSSSCSLLPA